MSTSECKRVKTYQDGLGIAHDFLLRCHECKKLVLYANLKKSGGCPTCGSRKSTEVRALSLWEWLLIKLRILDFPYRKEFLKEFSRGK